MVRRESGSREQRGSDGWRIEERVQTRIAMKPTGRWARRDEGGVDERGEVEGGGRDDNDDGVLGRR